MGILEKLGQSIGVAVIATGMMSLFATLLIVRLRGAKTVQQAMIMGVIAGAVVGVVLGVVSLFT